MLALPISKPRFKSIIYYQNSPEITLFLQKNAKFSSAGGSAPDLVPPAAGALFPDPQNSPLIANFWLCACMQSSSAKVVSTTEPADRTGPCPASPQMQNRFNSPKFTKQITPAQNGNDSIGTQPIHSNCFTIN